MDEQQRQTGTPNAEQPSPEDAFVKEQTAEIPTISVTEGPPVSAVDGRRPAPFVPDFAWRPGFNDFPVPLIASSAAARRRAQAESSGWEHWPNLDSVGQHRTPARYIPHVLAVAAIIAIVMSNGWWLDRFGGSDDTDTPLTSNVEQGGNVGTPDGESLLDRSAGDETSSASQTAAPDETKAPGGLDAGGVEGAAADATVTPDGPMIPDPSVASATGEVAVPDAGIITYTATGGETLVDVAEQYGLTPTTLMWANSISDPREELDEDAEIIVPPMDGVLYTVAAGDTLEKIATRYGSTAEAIVDFGPNGIGGSPNLRVGQLVMVPGGTISDWGEIQHYTVRDGDNLWTIASYYGLDPETLVWANDLPRPELISIGQDLIIPPGDGALIEVQAGDHVDAIAERFGVEATAIRAFGFNNLGNGRVLQVGQQLLVPGVPLPDLSGPSELNADTVAGEGAFNPATSTFLWPTDGFISQEFGGTHNGMDIANEEWTPVNAADGGIVIFAGWNDYGLGYAVGVDHGNGYQTWYGHLANQPYVEVGQVVWQGGYLGPMGNTGKSTGPHLHFIIMKDGVYQNPADYLD